MKKSPLLVSCGTILAVGTAWPATAQNRAEADANAKTTPSLTTANTTDIVVTARRRAEGLSKVPVAVTALTGDALVKQSVRTEQDLQLAVPGFLARQVGTANELSFSIRGQSIDGYSSSPPAVLAYINEFQVASPGSSTFFDLDGIEVLKGPQGTLFGRNTTGGAVLYRTKKPGNTFEGFAYGRYGNLGEKQFQAGVTIPIVNDRISLRIAGNYSDGGGFVRNLGYYAITGFAGGVPASVNFVPKHNMLGDMRDKSIRGTLWVSPSDGIQNTTLIQYSADDGTLVPGLLYSVFGGVSAQTPYNLMTVTTGPFQGTGALDQNAAWQRKTNREVYTELSNDSRSRTLLATNTTEINLSSDALLKNIVGWYKADKHSVVDLDGSAFFIYSNSEFHVDNPAGINGQHGVDTIFSDELQIQGNAFDSRLKYTAGVYYANARRLDDAHLQVYGASIPPYRFETRDRSYAGFAQLTYNLTRDLHLTGGFRYSRDDIDGHQLPFGFFSPPIFGGFPPSIAGTFEQNQKISFQNPSWTASIDYQVTPALLLYVTQRGSWRAGGFNFPAIPRTFDGTGQVTSSNPNGYIGNVFKPEKARDIEVGAKFNGRIADMPVLITADFYNQWVKDVQRTAYVLVNGSPGLVTANIPQAEITGEEASLNLQATRWLTIGGQISHIDARFTQPTTLAAGVPETYGPYGDVPEWSGSAFFEITKRMDDASSISLRGDVYAQSKVDFKSFTPPQSADTVLPGYALVNARLSWNNLLGTHLTAAVYGKNIFDKQWYAGGIATQVSFGVNVVSPGRPREYGLELRYAF